jgi:hypothetical protein
MEYSNAVKPTHHELIIQEIKKCFIEIDYYCKKADAYLDANMDFFEKKPERDLIVAIPVIIKKPIRSRKNNIFLKRKFF